MLDNSYWHDVHYTEIVTDEKRVLLIAGTKDVDATIRTELEETDYIVRIIDHTVYVFQEYD